MTHGRNVAYDELSLPVALEVDRLADQFRADWLAGRKPRIEDYIVRAADSAAQEQLLELLVEELELRRSTGEQPTVAEYKLRFDEYGDVVEQAFQQPSRRSDPHADTETFTDSSAHAMPNGGGAKRQPHSAPASIGRYRLEQYLGQGGFGQVWQAYDPELRRHVAIKFPRPDRGLAKQRVELLLHDARKAVEFASEGVVPVYDVGEANGVQFIVSAYMSGGSLADRLKNNDAKWDAEEAARLVARLAQALHRAHLKGLVHRDVKPGNILFDEQGQAYLTDFGLATSEQEQVKESPGTVGTWAYMSPEQVSGKSHRVDARADVYSLGVTLYRLLTGRLPFLADTAEEMRDQVLNREPRPLRTIDEGISRELEGICLKCMARDARQRYTTAADLSGDLRARLNSAEAGARELPFARVQGRLRRAMCIVVTACVVAGAFILARPFPAPPAVEPGTRTFRKLAPDELQLHRNYPLLRDEPTTVVGPSGSGDGKFFDRSAETLHVAYGGFGLFELGAVEQKSYTLRVDLRQQGPWHGQAGVFFGLSASKANPAEQAGQMIVLAPNTDRQTRSDFPIVAVRYRIEVIDGVRPRYPCLTAPYSETLEFIPSGERNQLEIGVRNYRLRTVRWGGRHLVELSANELNDCFEPVDYRGGFGLFAGQCSGVTFENAEVRIEEK